MPHKTTVREALIPLTKFPHMPYWFSLRQAITMLRIAALDPEPPSPRLVLVFDEKYQLLGLLRPEDILRGLEPRFLTSRPVAGWPTASGNELAVLWNDLAVSAEAAAAPIKDAMMAVKSTVGVDDTLARAATLMLAEGVPVIAAMDGTQVAGVVRLYDAYDAITAALTQA